MKKYKLEIIAFLFLVVIAILNNVEQDTMVSAINNFFIGLCFIAFGLTLLFKSK